jgi:hypothetical protein
MDSATLRAWWWHRQGLDGSYVGKTPAEVLAGTGWARSVGGVGPYLTLWSRGRISREGADAAVANAEIHELPAARGCTYVVPASDYALALLVGEGSTDAERKQAEKLGVTAKEIDKLCLAVVNALDRGPLTPDELKVAVGKAARSLGPEGAKKGLANTLPLALGDLQLTGVLRRIPMNGRLDQQRYRYTRWTPSPLSAYKLSKPEAMVELARRYFQWAGPATVAQYQSFSGQGVKAAKETLAPLGLIPMDSGDPRLLFPQDREALLAFRPPKDRHYSLVSSLDGISLLRRDLKSLFEDADFGKAFSGLADLPSHAIIDRGRLVGLWEFDPDTNSIAWMCFGKKDKALESAVKATEDYVKDQLGDARSFSLDSPKSRAPRIAGLRAGILS